MGRTKKALLCGAVPGYAKARIIANNTLRIEYPTYFTIRLHNTDILIFENNSVSLHTDGWYTNTTRDRINRYLPKGYQIYTHKNEWYLLIKGKKYPFKNGVQIDLNTDYVQYPV